MLVFATVGRQGRAKWLLSPLGFIKQQPHSFLLHHHAFVPLTLTTVFEFVDSVFPFQHCTVLVSCSF